MTHLFFLFFTREKNKNKEKTPKSLNRDIHHKANQQGRGARSSPQYNSADALKAVASCRGSASNRGANAAQAWPEHQHPWWSKHPGYLSPQRGGWLSSPRQLSQTSSHTAEWMDLNNNPQRPLCSWFSLHWSKTTEPGADRIMCHV